MPTIQVVGDVIHDGTITNADGNDFARIDGILIAVIDSTTTCSHGSGTLVSNGSSFASIAGKAIALKGQTLNNYGDACNGTTQDYASVSE